MRRRSRTQGGGTRQCGRGDEGQSIGVPRSLLSIAAVLGNPGQADYAAANAFMDAYVAYRERLVQRGERRGRSVAIDWGLWKDGGMGADAGTEAALRRAYGLTAMDTATGVDAFHRVVAEEAHRVVIVHGDATDLRRAVCGDGEERAGWPAPDAEADSAGQGDAEDLRLRSEHYLQEIISSIAGIPAQKLRGEGLFQDLGIDSVMALRLTTRLEKDLGPLSKTLFFEWQTTHELAAYLASHCAPALSKVVAPDGQTVKERSARLHGTQAVHPAPEQALQVGGRYGPPSRPGRPEREEVAVVGHRGSLSLGPAMWRPSGRTSSAEWTPSWRYRRSGGTAGCTTSPRRACRGRPTAEWGGFIDGVEEFDPLFFNMSPSEADVTDPQERLFLETVWTLLEREGYTRAGLRERYDGKVGLWSGRCTRTTNPSSRTSRLNRAWRSPRTARSPIVCLTSSDGGPEHRCGHHVLLGDRRRPYGVRESGRGGMRAGSRGRREPVDPPEEVRRLDAAGVVGSSPDSRSFSAGDGYLPAEAVAAVLLKPLTRAVADGDRIWAVVKSSAINHSGRASSSGLPAGQAQAKLLEEDFRKAGMTRGQ